MNARLEKTLSLVLIFLIAYVAIAQLFPRKVIPAEAKASEFSGERAMLHLPTISSEPHPQGSPALGRVRDYLVKNLTEADLEVEIQNVSTLQNVVARLHGTNPTGAIIILTHYDTVSNSPGAGDNSSTVAALVEIMRALAVGPAPKNDVIALFHDGEEYPDIMAGTKAFVRSHPWMKDVRVVISLDSAIASFISTNEVGPQNNGWLVDVLARAYTGGLWMSFSGGGEYNSKPFHNAGIPVLALEDNYPFRQKHTPEDVPEIIHAGSVQQIGEQTVSIMRVLGELNLDNPWGEQQTFFSVPVIGFIHYPVKWTFPVAIITVTFMGVGFGLSIWRRVISWRGVVISFGGMLITSAFSAVVVALILPKLPGLFGWEIDRWQEWPEVIPPNGGLVAGLLGLLVLGIALTVYTMARRWSSRFEFSIIWLMPFGILSVVLAKVEPRTAYAFSWPVMISSLIWIGTVFIKTQNRKRYLNLITTSMAIPLILIFLPFLPGIIMADGMKSLAILAVILSILLIGAILPAVEPLSLFNKIKFDYE